MKYKFNSYTVHSMCPGKLDKVFSRSFAGAWSSGWREFTFATIARRSRMPSAQALRNRLRNLPDADSPPDVFAEAVPEAHFNKLEQERDVIDHFEAQLNFFTWSALRNDLERKLNQVYAEVWATLGSGAGEDERNYHKLITESPHK